MKITECTKSPSPPRQERPPALPAEPCDRFEPRPWPREARPLRAPKPPPEPPGPLVQLATQLEEVQQDWQSAREILARVEAMRRLTDQRIAAILADLSTQIFSIWQEVMARRRKACDEALARWSKLMFE